MTPQLESCAGLSTQHLAAIASLEAQCNQFENLSMKLNWATLAKRPTHETNDFFLRDADGHYLAYLALYQFNQEEAEVSAMTLPDCRQRGYFKRLLAAACEELKRRQIPNLLFICERVSSSAQACMQAMGAEYDFSEYKMTLRHIVPSLPAPDGFLFRRAEATDLQLITHLDLINFGAPTQVDFENQEDSRQIWIGVVRGKRVGKIHLSYHGTGVSIYAFGVMPEFRRRGYGTAMLRQAIQMVPDDLKKSVFLEVATENKHALKLYERCGFEVETAYDYYRLPVRSQ